MSPTFEILKPLNPQELPPTPGIQSGTSIENRILLILPITELRALSTVLKAEIIALIGFLASEPNPLNTFVKVFLILLHAFFHLFRNLLFMKVIIPLK